MWVGKGRIVTWVICMALGLPGAELVYAVPPTTQNLQPTNGQTNISRNPTLEIDCTDQSLESAHYVIATDSSFSSPLTYDSLENANDLCSHMAFVNLDPQAQYFWRARL